MMRCMYRIAKTGRLEGAPKAMRWHTVGRVCFECRGIQVRPYPWPLGNDGKLPLLSSNADTFHAANAHRGTVVRDCYFTNAGKEVRHGRHLQHLQAAPMPMPELVVMVSKLKFFAAF